MGRNQAQAKNTQVSVSTRTVPPGARSTMFIPSASIDGWHTAGTAPSRPASQLVSVAGTAAGSEAKLAMMEERSAVLVDCPVAICSVCVLT